MRPEDGREAFLEGWHYGSGPDAVGLTARQIGERWPHLSGPDIDCFVQGMADGRAGCRFRLDLARGVDYETALARVRSAPRAD